MLPYLLSSYASPPILYSRRLGSGWLVGWLRAGCVFIAFFKPLPHRVAVKGIFLLGTEVYFRKA